MPRSSASPPAAATRPSTLNALDETIWSGPRGTPGATSSSPVDEHGDARRPGDGERRIIGGGGQRHIGGAEPAARAQNDLALVEIDARDA